MNTLITASLSARTCHGQHAAFLNGSVVHTIPFARQRIVPEKKMMAAASSVISMEHWPEPMLTSLGASLLS